MDGNRDGSASVANDVELGWGLKTAPPTRRPTPRVIRTMAPTTRSPTANLALLRTMAPTTRSPTAVPATVVGAGISCLRSDLTCPNSADPRCSRCDKGLTCVVRAANHTLGTCMLVTSTPPALPDTCAKDQACFDAVYTCATCCTSGTQLQTCFFPPCICVRESTSVFVVCGGL